MYFTKYAIFRSHVHTDGTFLKMLFLDTCLWYFTKNAIFRGHSIFSDMHLHMLMVLYFYKNAIFKYMLNAYGIY